MSTAVRNNKKIETNGGGKEKEKDLNVLVEKLAISSTTSRPNSTKKKFDDLPKRGPIFEKELGKTSLTIFECMSDLGYFTWTPKKGSSYKSLADVSCQEVRDQINFNGKPDQLVPISSMRLPQTFRSLPPQEYHNKFPFGQIDIACLHGASSHHRGLNFIADHDGGGVDFALGGSTLEMLATKDAASSPFFVTCVPGTNKNTILVVKRKEYVQNLSDVGFQFERLVTGKRMEDRLPVEFTEHMHLMKVDGRYNVLFRAETDAVKDGEPIEVKASNPRYWGTKVMFQMISSGSPKLCHGVKGRGTLTRVDLKDLSDVSRTAIGSGRSVSELERNIVDGMDALKSQIEEKHNNNKEEGTVFKLSFAGGQLKLLDVTTRSATALLPPAHIVKELV